MLQKYTITRFRPRAKKKNTNGNKQERFWRDYTFCGEEKKKSCINKIMFVVLEIRYTFNYFIN